MLNKCEQSGADPYMALLNIRTTTNILGVSPSQLLMSRLLRTKLPIANQNLRPSIIDRNKHNKALENQQKDMCKHFDKGTKQYPDFENGEKVYFKKNPDGRWIHGKIKEKLDLPRSYLIEDVFGSTFRRNKKHINKDKAISTDCIEKTLDRSYLEKEHEE